MPFVRPENKVLVAGQPLVEELLTEGTAVKPRLLVAKGTGDNQVSPAGAGATNVLGAADYDARYNIDDAFPDAHPVRVLKGNIIVVLILAASQTITKGQKLMAAANGEVQAFSPAAAGDSAKIIGYAEESVTTGVGETKPIMVRLVI
jgi:hypothetical protein